MSHVIYINNVICACVDRGPVAAEFEYCVLCHTLYLNMHIWHYWYVCAMTHTYIWMYIYICKYQSMHIYIYVYTHTHTYMYMSPMCDGFSVCTSFGLWWLIDMCVMTVHDSFTCVPWRLNGEYFWVMICDMIYAYATWCMLVWRDSFICAMTFEWGMYSGDDMCRDMCTCDMTHVCVPWLLHSCHGLSMGSVLEWW